jgi:hypothetical protein
LLTFGASCGKVVQPQAASPSPSLKANGIAVNWDNPIGGVQVSDIAQVQPSLGFSAYEPRNLGPPKARFVDLTPPIMDRMVAFIYDTTATGRVVVEEIKLDRSVKQFNADQEGAIADMNSRRTGPGHDEVVSIRNGLEGFLSLDDAGNAYMLMWAEPSGLEFLIRGPALSKDSIISIANGL